MSLKDIYELAIAELANEPQHSYVVLQELIEHYSDFSEVEILQKINMFDAYVYDFLNKEEYYATVSNFQKLELLKSDIAYYRATFYRIRYHFTYFDVDRRKFQNVFQYGLHLANNLKEWLDFHVETLDGELIKHLKSELSRINSES